jgi:cobalt-zinc-cadmium resistance protein CzcA
MVENISRRLTHRDPTTGRGDLIGQAAREVGRPILFGILIIIAVYLPIMTLQGMEGKMFKPMAMTVVLALVGSLVLTLTFIPSISSLFLKERGTHTEPKLIHAVRRFYTPMLEKALSRKPLTIAAAGIVLLGSLALVPFLGSEFIPELDEGAILVQPIRMPGVSLTESIEMEKKIQKIIMQFPEVEFVVGRLGRPDIATDPMGVNLSDIYVTLRPKSEWKTTRTKEELVEKMVAELKHVPGINYNITQPIAMRVDELVSGVKSDIAVKLFGDDLNLLEEKAEEIAEIIRGIPGASDVSTEQVAGQTYLNIHIDRGAIARYGLNVVDVQRVIEIAIGGKIATEVVEGDARYGVLVRYPGDVRGDLAGIENTLVSLPGGGTVPLSQISRIVAEEGPVQVSREYGRRRIVVESNVRGTDIGSFVAEAKKRIDDSIELPAGYYITWGGQFEHQQSATNRLMVVVPVSIFIIFVLLFTAFGNLRHTLLILLNLPFALCGGIITLYARDLPLSVSASVGFVALFGVAVLNGVVLISHINLLLKEGHELTFSIVRGASDRLRPVLMTALVASLGFVPMALSQGTGAEVQRPLATVVIGGLVTSTILTLFVIPVIYSVIEGRRKKPDRARTA